MEIKCKVSFAIPEELMKALNITDDTPVIAFISDGRITVEIVDEDDLYDEDFCEDDLYDDEDSDCDEDCEYCEYYCTHCQKCVLDE
jgi:antitoxin component of MazEF toxin-antitoxin module